MKCANEFRLSAILHDVMGCKGLSSRDVAAQAGGCCCCQVSLLCPPWNVEGLAKDGHGSRLSGFADNGHGTFLQCSLCSSTASMQSAMGLQHESQEMCL